MFSFLNGMFGKKDDSANVSDDSVMMDNPVQEPMTQPEAPDVATTEAPSQEPVVEPTSPETVNSEAPRAELAGDDEVIINEPETQPNTEASTEGPNEENTQGVPSEGDEEPQMM